MSYGWMPVVPSSPSIIEGIYLDKAATKTRSEEYVWFRDRVPWGSYVLDAATGYVHSWHIMPEILDKLKKVKGSMKVVIRTYEDKFNL